MISNSIAIQMPFFTSDNYLHKEFARVTATTRSDYFKFCAPEKTTLGTRLLTKVGKYSLAHRILIEIIYEDAIYLAKNAEFNVWGEGSTEKDAIRSLENFILYDFNSYRKTPEDKLDECAKQELAKYKTLIHIVK